MALVGELKYIQELHDKGGLSDQEYTDAKAALLKPGAQNVGEEKKPSGSSTASGQVGCDKKAPECREPGPFVRTMHLGCVVTAAGR
jgi:hypothetical protein